PGHRRLRGRLAAACRRAPPADPLPHRPRLPRRQAQGPHGWRRRLRDEALLARGGHRPDPGHPAPQPALPLRRRRAALRRPGAGRRRPRGAPGRPRRGRVADRVQAAALPHAQPQPGALQGPDPRPRLGLRLPWRDGHRRVLHLLPAPQDRHRGPPTADPHQARIRVRPAAPARGVIVRRLSESIVRRLEAVPLTWRLIVILLSLLLAALTITSTVTAYLLQ